MSGEFRIGNKTPSKGSTFVIAEIGNNHNGSLQVAKTLVDEAREAGADCVKFQIRDRESLYRKPPNGASSEDLGVEYVKDLLAKVELTVEEHRELRDYVAQSGLLYMCTPWDEISVGVLRGFNVDAVKVASADLFNPFLIQCIAGLGKPFILSTGMSYEYEIVRAVEHSKTLGVPFAILHCNSAYPAPDRDIQLDLIQRLRRLHDVVGYSGHERGTAISIAAVALGACIIERHLTLDRMMEGPDHPASLEPNEFRRLVEGIRQVDEALPVRAETRTPSQGEMLNRENLSKSVIARADIPKGTIVTADQLAVASPGRGLAPYRLPDLIGRLAIRNVRAGDFMVEADLSGEALSNKAYKFPLLWGIPIRYHDFLEYENRIIPDLYEFHHSYRDLGLDPAEYVKEVDCRRLVVHAPELFENSELLDLVSDDLDYRRRSISNIKRVIDATESVRKYFPKADSALIVANVGGFSMDAPVSAEKRRIYYDRFAEVIRSIDFGSTELIPQNMAPFPWHFGGQRHQNIFMYPDELVEAAKSNNLRLCLDLSHLSMTCSHFGFDFQTELKKLLPVTAHLHIADAVDVRGEGVDLGQGDIDWGKTWPIIAAERNLSFIPEVWQGHKNFGAGFWKALTFLSQLNPA
ncbi:MAG: N-acetylneuraminate synthase family protein [Pseudomonadota bacterium]